MFFIRSSFHLRLAGPEAGSSTGAAFIVKAVPWALQFHPGILFVDRRFVLNILCSVCVVKGGSVFS